MKSTLGVREILVWSAALAAQCGWFLFLCGIDPTLSNYIRSEADRRDAEAFNRKMERVNWSLRSKLTYNSKNRLRLKGATAHEVVSWLGEPDQISTTSAGDEKWTYQTSKPCSEGIRLCWEELHLTVSSRPTPLLDDRRSRTVVDQYIEPCAY